MPLENNSDSSYSIARSRIVFSNEALSASDLSVTRTKAVDSEEIDEAFVIVRNGDFGGN